MRLGFLFLFSLFFIMVGCGTDMADNTNENRADVLRLSNEQPHPGGIATEHPADMRHLEGGFRIDRDQIQDAAETVDGVEVQRVTFLGTSVQVVIQNQGNENDEELVKRVQNVVQRAVPRYRIDVLMD
ncbi:hypothetical protein RZN22_12690 [Bacillaceae bacterium S4-13-58]